MNMFAKRPDSQFVKRLKSFLWRTGMMVLAVTIDIVASNLGMLELNPEVTVLLGLALGEVSKYLNSSTSR